MPYFNPPPDSPPQPRARLDAAIERLYTVFARYRPDTLEHSCECCIERHEIEFLRGTALRGFSADQLERFAWKSMTTFGTARDYKYFLPRICELIASLGGWPTNIEVALGGKLGLADLTNWPPDERQAVEEYLSALFCCALMSWPAAPEIDAILYSVARSGIGIEPALTAWAQLSRENTLARAHLAEFVGFNMSAFPAPEPPPFWGECRDEWSRLLNWLQSAEIAAIVDAGFPDWLNTDDGSGYEYMRDRYRDWAARRADSSR